MSIESTTLTKHLPDLRRYARLLTGHQKMGDVLVLATLQSLANADMISRGSTEHPLQNLYHVLTRLWRSPVGDHFGVLPELIECEHSADQRLGTMVPVARAAFLLVSVEGFSKRAAAQILHATEAEFQVMLNTAHIDVSRHLASDVLIIEDELLIAFELEDLMQRLGHRVTSVVRTKRLALKQARLWRPSLILADINLADGSSGIDAVNEILTTTIAPVIFITAYPERLLTGGCPEPTFVITKPFRAEEIQAVVGQALFFDLKAQSGISADTCPSELISSCFPKSLRS